MGYSNDALRVTAFDSIDAERVPDHTASLDRRRMSTIDVLSRNDNMEYVSS